MNNKAKRIVWTCITFFALFLIPCSSLFSFPLTNGNTRLVQDVYASGGYVGRTGGSCYMEADVIGQPALVGSSFNAAHHLSHGYLGGGTSGLAAFYIRSSILSPQADSFVDRLGTVTGRVVSPVQIREEKITLQRLADSLYFDGSVWQDQQVWLTCSGIADWGYPVPDDRSVFEYGLQYRVTAKGTDVTGAEETEYPSITFTYLFSADFRSSICNYPNPFYPDSSDASRNTTTIEYFLSTERKVSIYVYAMNGELVRSWSGADYGRTGLHRIKWDGKNRNGTGVGNGIYMLVVDIGHQQVMEKMSVIR